MIISNEFNRNNLRNKIFPFIAFILTFHYIYIYIYIHIQMKENEKHFQNDLCHLKEGREEMKISFKF